MHMLKEDTSACRGGSASLSAQDRGIDYSQGILITGKQRRCTDIPCCVIFLAHWALFVFVTFYGMQSANPAKLFKPRDFKGDYCGIQKQWNSGSNLQSFENQLYTMNVSRTVDLIVKELICSSVVDETIQRNGILNSSEYNDYLCACCKRACSTCTGSLQVGDLTNSASLSTAISGKMDELTSLSGSSLFSVSGFNGNLFSNIWGQANEYFVGVCSTSCSATSGTNDTRSYTYSPGPDNPLKKAWEQVAANSNTPPGIRDTINTRFTFHALPGRVCPYDTRYCVPFPGVEFSDSPNGFCTFKMSSDVINQVGGVAASAFEGLGADKFTSNAVETFGQWLGDLEKTIDVFGITSICAFVIGIIFLVLLRFCVGTVVWTSLLIVWLIFLGGGALAFVRSGQCNGTSLLESGQQASRQIVVSAGNAVQNQFSGRGGSEVMTGNGADYRGFQSTTRSGRTCQNWGVQTPHNHSETPQRYPLADLNNNHCRNPDQSDPASSIWCYTTDPATRWQLCAPIGVLQPECSRGYAVEGQKARTALKICSYIIFGIAGLWLIFCMCMCNRIRLAIACAKVAAAFTYQTPVVLLVPIFQTILGIMWCVLWALSATFLISQVPDGYTPISSFASYEDAVAACQNKNSQSLVWKDERCLAGTDGTLRCWKCAPPRYIVDARIWFSFFSFLWNNAFLVATGQCIIAGAVVVWFFRPHKQKTRNGKVQAAFFNAIRFHLGSLAFGAFILALVQFIRFFLKYVEKQAAAQKNHLMAWALRIVQCILWCFEKCIRFLNKNAYIQIAVKGTNFCVSARNAFQLILSNIVRFGIIAILGSMIHFVGYVFIMAATLATGYFLLQALAPEVNPIVPMIAYGFLGYLVGRLYMNVYGMAVDTCLQCFLTCEEKAGSIQANMKEFVPKEMQKFISTHTQDMKNKGEIDVK